MSSINLQMNRLFIFLLTISLIVVSCGEQGALYIEKDNQKTEKTK